MSARLTREQEISELTKYWVREGYWVDDDHFEPGNPAHRVLFYKGADVVAVLAALREELAQAQAENARLRDMLQEAYSLFGRHQGHFDRTGGSGTGCPVCVEQRELRHKHEAALDTRKM